MNKGSIILVLALVLSLSLVGCTGGPEAESAWEVLIGEKVFAIETIKELTTITFDVEAKDEVHSYTGVRLNDLLVQADLTDFNVLILEAEDGYSFEITREAAISDNSILAFAMNGEDLTDSKTAPLMFVSSVTSPQAWVGQLKFIQVGE